METTGTPSEIETVFFSALLLLLSNYHFRSFEGFLELIYLQFISSNYIFFTATAGRLPYELNFFIATVDYLRDCVPSTFGLEYPLLRFLSFHTFSPRFQTFTTPHQTTSIFTQLLHSNQRWSSASYRPGPVNYVALWPANVCIFPPRWSTRFVDSLNQKVPLFSSHDTFDILRLNDNRLFAFPEYIFRKIHHGDVKEIRLQHNNLSHVPESLLRFESLQPSTSPTTPSASSRHSGTSCPC